MVNQSLDLSRDPQCEKTKILSDPHHEFSQDLDLAFSKKNPWIHQWRQILWNTVAHSALTDNGFSLDDIYNDWCATIMASIWLLTSEMKKVSLKTALPGEIYFWSNHVPFVLSTQPQTCINSGLLKLNIFGFQVPTRPIYDSSFQASKWFMFASGHTVYFIVDWRVNPEFSFF